MACNQGRNGIKVRCICKALFLHLFTFFFCLYFCTLFDVILSYSMVTVELKPKRNICSTQSENLRNLEIVLCILRILRLRNYSVQSYACTLLICKMVCYITAKGWRWQDNGDRRQFMHQHLNDLTILLTDLWTGTTRCCLNRASPFSSDWTFHVLGVRHMVCKLIPSSLNNTIVQL